MLADCSQEGGKGSEVLLFLGLKLQGGSGGLHDYFEQRLLLPGRVCKIPWDEHRLNELLINPEMKIRQNK